MSYRVSSALYRVSVVDDYAYRIADAHNPSAFVLTEKLYVAVVDYTYAVVRAYFTERCRRVRTLHSIRHFQQVFLTMLYRLISIDLSPHVYYATRGDF